MTTISEQIQQANSWQQRYKILLTAGKEPCVLDIRDEQNRVNACQAKTWVLHQLDNNQHHFIIDSESALIKGIGKVLSEKANNISEEELLAINWQDYLQQLGILNQLSPSRSNGINALIKAMLAKTS